MWKQYWNPATRRRWIARLVIGNLPLMTFSWATPAPAQQRGWKTFALGIGTYVHPAVARATKAGPRAYHRKYRLASLPRSRRVKRRTYRRTLIARSPHSIHLALGYGRTPVRRDRYSSNPNFTQQVAQRYVAQYVKPVYISATALEVPDGGDSTREDRVPGGAYQINGNSVPAETLADVDGSWEDNEEDSDSDLRIQRSEEATLVLASLDAVSRGDIQRGLDLLAPGLRYHDPEGPVQPLYDGLEEGVQSGNKLGYVELKTDEESHRLRVDGQWMDTTLPCGVIAGQGQHDFEIFTNTGRNYHFFVNVQGFAKTSISLDIAQKHYSVDGGGNEFYAAQSANLSAWGDADTYFELPIAPDDLAALDIPRRRLYIGVTAPPGTEVNWDISWDGIHKENHWGNEWIPLTQAPGKSCFVHIHCRTGGGQCWVYTGYGVAPAPQDLPD